MSEKKIPEIPDPIEVRNDFSKTIEDLDFLIEFISTKQHVSFFEFHAQLHTTNLELIKIWNKTLLLKWTDKKYRKAHEQLRKILIKMVIEPNDIETRHTRDLLFWESAFQKGKLRKDLINHFKDVSKQLKKTAKNI
jgi:hypothetical protein